MLIAQYAFSCGDDLAENRLCFCISAIRRKAAGKIMGGGQRKRRLVSLRGASSFVRLSCRLDSRLIVPTVYEHLAQIVEQFRIRFDAGIFLGSLTQG